jgi:Ca-activated chloride channel family protein
MTRTILAALALAIGCDAEETPPPREPLNLAIAIDTSGSMLGPSIEHVRRGLATMAASLGPDDRVTLVTFSDAAHVHVEAVAGDSAELRAAIDAVQATGQTNVYAGLRAAFEATERHADPQRRNRVVLLSDGQATTGLVHDPRLLTMARAYGAVGLPLHTIGVGLEFDPQLLRGLAERGGGTFHPVEDPAAVVHAFAIEALARAEAPPGG